MHHRNHQDRVAHVGRPVRDRGSGNWVIPITRRIDNPDGSFAGVAIAALSVNYFQQFYERFDIGAGGAILLASLDGTLLVRRPFSEAAMGRDLSQGGIFRELLPQGPHGSGEIRSSTDGVVRLNSYRRLDAYPLLLAVAEDKDEVLAPWRERARINALRAIAMSGIIAILGFVLWRRTRKIAEQGALLKATLDNMNQGLIVVDEKGTLPICNRRALELLDIYGHPAGDSSLRAIALALRHSLNRPADFVARYGGEEFALLVPNTAESGTFALAERLREAVLSLRIPHETSPRKIVTISLGVASMMPAEGTHRAVDLVTAADTALYAAKKAGRDQTRLAEPGPVLRESRSA
jgi:diguanylate cyclase (GGDEF)-like protein